MSRAVKSGSPHLKSPPRRVPVRPLRVAREIRYRGLCSTCENAPDCVFPRAPGKAIFHCEEFDGGEPRPAGQAGQQSPEASVSRKKNSVKFIGLCSNCDNRTTCVFPKPEGGVWHCEEYV